MTIQVKLPAKRMLPSGTGAPALLWFVLLLIPGMVLLPTTPSFAQRPALPDSLVPGGLPAGMAEGDTIFVTTEGDTVIVNQQGQGAGLSAATMAANQRANSRSISLASDPNLPFFNAFTNSPLAGVKSDVRVNKYFGELGTNLTMLGGSNFANTASFSWDDFRQTNKTVETRGDRFSYNAGSLLPLRFSASGNWDWSEDQTVNNAGLANLSKRDLKSGSVRASKTDLAVGAFQTKMSTSLGMRDQKSTNRDVVNNMKEGHLDAGGQVGTQLTSGITVAGRLYGKTASGEKTLGHDTAPTSANGDTLGAGIYFDQDFTSGRLSITRSNFEKRFLDYNRNANGQIDTVGLDEFDKVVDELETKNAITLEFENEFRVGRLGFNTNFSRSTDELALAASGAGAKERLNDTAEFGLTYGTRRDSISVSFGYLWKWDDQRIKNATANRGKQYTKNRKLIAYYGRDLFTATNIFLKMHHELGQDTAENQFNSNDKDRLRSDVALGLTRSWPGKFKVNLLFSFKQSEEVSLHSSRSSNNNIKDSYEVSPGFNWYITDWLTMNQKYRVYIQYTDFVYSHLETVNKDDNYNKRGNVNTIVVIEPTERLEIAIRHDYNKRLSADRISTDATGNSYYFTTQNQDINKIDLGADFAVANGVTLEAATFRTRDFKTTYGTATRETEVFSGEIWVGARVVRTWGTKNPLELAAMVKKFNAFGPSVTEASRDFWEADIQLKWTF